MLSIEMDIFEGKGISHGLPFHDPVFQAWFVGVPVSYFAMKFAFRAFDWWPLYTRKGTRTSDIMAFMYSALWPIIWMGVSGVIIRFDLFGMDEYESLMKDPYYGYSEYCLHNLIYPMMSFQGWNLMLCFFNKDLNDIYMIIHHFLTTSLAYFGLHPYLHGGSVFFFGIAECTNILLTAYDAFKYLNFHASQAKLMLNASDPKKESEGKITKENQALLDSKAVSNETLQILSVNPEDNYPVLFSISKYGFAVAFVGVRIIWWPPVSYQFWLDSYDILMTGKAHSEFVVGFFLVANLFLTVLQFIWLRLILQSAGILPKAAKEKDKGQKSE